MTGFLKKQGKTLEEGLVLFFRTWGEAGGGESMESIKSPLAWQERGILKLTLTFSFRFPRGSP